MESATPREGTQREHLLWYLPTEVQYETVEQEMRNNITTLTDPHIHRAMPEYWSVPAFLRCIKNKEITTKFLDDGAPVNCMFIGRLHLSARNPSGYPIARYPIEVAAHGASLDIIKLLVERGANITNTNALHNAVTAHVNSRDSRSEEETLRVIEYLLSKGCDINRREFQGEDFIAPFSDAHHSPRKFGTPLQYAVYHAYERRIKFLLEHGADPMIPAYNSNTKEYYGTALDWINRFAKKPEVCERLRSILLPWMKENFSETESPSEK